MARRARSSRPMRVSRRIVIPVPGRERGDFGSISRTSRSLARALTYAAIPTWTARPGLLRLCDPPPPTPLLSACRERPDARSTDYLVGRGDTGHARAAPLLFVGFEHSRARRVEQGQSTQRAY